MGQDIHAGCIHVGDQLRVHLPGATIEGELTAREIDEGQPLVVIGGFTFDIRRATRIELLERAPQWEPGQLAMIQWASQSALASYQRDGSWLQVTSGGRVDGPLVTAVLPMKAVPE
jgi:hypothetical protein